MPDLVDCARAADETAVLERVYELGALHRLSDLLAEPTGLLTARFAFSRLASEHAGAVVTVSAVPHLVCQRCMHSVAVTLTGESEIEFIAGDESRGIESARESYEMENGQVSLRGLAEEEMLLALPRIFMCTTPLTCGNAQNCASGETALDPVGDMRRPFGALRNLLKNT